MWADFSQVIWGLALRQDLDWLHQGWDDLFDHLSSCHELWLQSRLGRLDCDNWWLADCWCSNLNEWVLLLCQLLHLLDCNRLSPWDNGSLPPPSPPSGSLRCSNCGLPGSLGSWVGSHLNQKSLISYGMPFWSNIIFWSGTSMWLVAHKLQSWRHWSITQLWNSSRHRWLCA